MKNNLKENKGITLVALIITIIILLILAVVTIRAVNEGSLFAHANNAATSYQRSAELENTKISEYLSKIEEYNGKNIQQPINNKITLTITNDNTLVETANVLSTTYSETLTAILEDDMDPSLLTWSANNENVEITGSGTSVTITGVKDGSTVVTANYNNGEFIQTTNLTIQNKWRQRGLTTEYVEFDATYAGNIGELNQSMSFNRDGSVSAITGGLTSDQMDQAIANAGDANADFGVTVTSDSVIVEFPSSPTSNQTYTCTADGIYTTYHDLNGILVKE